MGKRTAKIRPIDIGILLLREIHILAPRTVHLDPRSPDILAHTNGQHILPFAEHSRTHPELPQQKLLAHESQSLGRENEPRMD